MFSLILISNSLFNVGGAIKLGQCFSLLTSSWQLGYCNPCDIACLHGLRVISLAVIMLGNTVLIGLASKSIGS